MSLFEATMSIPSGFEASIFVLKPSEKFTCPLCLNVLRDARICSNGHNFCFGCITTLLERRNQCPVCEVELDVNKLVRNLFLNEMVDEKETFCPTCDLIVDKSSVDHCHWIGELHTRDKHYEMECGYKFVTCPNELCGLELKKQDLDQHLQTDCCAFSLEKLSLEVESDEEEDESADMQPVDNQKAHGSTGKKKKKRKSKKKKSASQLIFQDATSSVPENLQELFYCCISEVCWSCVLFRFVNLIS
jgi:hypothetical protein